MCAHCLLPALLVLAAPGYSTAQEPPYKVIDTKGRIDIPLSTQYDFYLRYGQCRGVLEPLIPEYVYCPPPTVIAALQVIVKDYMTDIQTNMSDDLNSVDITREPPCWGVSPVLLRVGCAYPAPPNLNVL